MHLTFETVVDLVCTTIIGWVCLRYVLFYLIKGIFLLIKSFILFLFKGIPNRIHEAKEFKLREENEAKQRAAKQKAAEQKEAEQRAIYEQYTAPLIPPVIPDTSAINHFLISRGITRLVHFTKAENLLSIFSHGLVPNSELASIGQEAAINDQKRFDGNRRANCLSVEFPNYKLFNSFRGPSNAWVVLCLNPTLLNSHKSLFFPQNASSLSMKRAGHIFDGLSDFEAMFSGNDGHGGIPLSYTTNPQAEVQVFGRIMPSFIYAVLFPNLDELQKWKYLIPNSVAVRVDKSVFEKRSDWALWSNMGRNN